MSIDVASAPRPTASSTASASGVPGTDTTSGVAQSRMAANASTSGAPLTGDTTVAGYDFQNHLEIAETQLLEGNKEHALKHFNEIYDYARTENANLPMTSFFLIRCLLGLASCSAKEADRSRYSSLALIEVNKAYKCKANWNKEEISPAHSELRWHLKKLKPFLPLTLVDYIAENDARIAKCANFILPIDAFKEKMKEVRECLIRKDTTTAERLYEEALDLIQDKNEIEFKVTQVSCLLKLTSASKSDHPIRVTMRDRAQAALFDLLECQASLSETAQYTRAKAFSLVIGYLRVLRNLTPVADAKNRRDIQQRIDACREIPKLAATKAPTPNLAPGPTSSPAGSDPISGGPSRKVTLGSPDGSWWLEGLFAAVVCIAALAIANFVIYRRYNVKVN